MSNTQALNQRHLDKASSAHPKNTNFLSHYGLWQNRITAWLLPFSLFSFAFEHQAVSIMLSASYATLITGSSLLVLSILIDYLTRFKQRPIYKFDSYLLPFFALGLIATGVACLFIPKMIVDYSLLALTPLPFVLPCLLSPITVYLKQPRKIPPKYIPERMHHLLVALAGISGYFMFSNYDFFFTIPGVIFETLLDLAPASSLFSASYPLLATGIYGMIMALAGVVYSKLTHQKLFGINKTLYFYLLAFSFGLAVVTTLNLVGVLSPLLFNFIGIGSFILSSVAGTIVQAFKQHRAIEHHELTQSYRDTLDQLSLDDKASLEKALIKRSVIDKTTREPLLKPVKTRNKDGTFSIQDKSRLKADDPRCEPHIDTFFQRENVRALKAVTQGKDVEINTSLSSSLEPEASSKVLESSLLTSGSSQL